MPEGRVVVKFGMTPAAKVHKRLLRGLDWTSSGVLIGSLGIAVAAALSAPISAPVLAGAAVGSSVAAMYGATRSGATLVDRKLHEQTINVKNSEARSCWIGIGGAVFALSASSATLLLERAVELGQAVGTSALYTVNGLNTGALVFNAAGVANQAHYLGERLVKGESITAFEVLEFTLSTFLFTNALVSFQTANAQILEGHKEAVSALQTGDAKKTGIMDRFVRHFEAENLFDRNSRVIRTLNSIDNPKQFFTKSMELTKQINKVANKATTQHKQRYDVNGAVLDAGLASSQTSQYLNVPSSPNSNFPRTFSEPNLGKIEGSRPSIIQRSRAEKILLNDYKFLEMIHIEGHGIEGVKKLESKALQSFEPINNKEFTCELIKICILVSKNLGIDTTDEFIHMCSSAKKIFKCNTQPLLKRFSSDVEDVVLEQLKTPESAVYKGLHDELLLEFFRKLNDLNKFRFEDASSAYKSYETYSNSLKLQPLKPLKAKEFMEKVNWLFMSNKPQDKNLVTYNGRSQFRNFYMVDGWRGVLYEDEKNPKNRVVTEFELKGDPNQGQEKKGVIDKIGSIFGH